MKVATTALLAASLVAAAPSKRQAANINDLFVAKGKKYFGTITDPNLLGDAKDTAAIQATFGQVTPENR